MAILSSLLVVLVVANEVSGVSLKGYDCERPKGVRVYAATEIEQCLDNGKENLTVTTRQGQIIKKDPHVQFL